MIQGVTRLLILFALALVLLLIVSPLLLLRPLGNSPFLISDVIDLIFTGPVLFLSFYLIDRSITVHDNHRRPLLQLGKLFSVVLFFEGYGVHFSANSIHHYIFDLQPIPEAVRSLIFYYDEILGHQMIFGGLFGLLLTGSITQLLNPLRKPMDQSNQLMLTGAAIVSGIVFGLSIIDGHFIVPGSVIAAAMLVTFITYLRKYRRPLSLHPLTLYTLIALATLQIFLLGWYLVFDGFPHPSQVFS